jgi:hypothetical protein
MRTAPTSIVTLVEPLGFEAKPNLQSLSALANDDGTSDNLTYNPITGRHIAHTYANNGNYDVVLTVALIIVSIDKPTTIKEGESALFKAIGMHDYLNDRIIEYR